MELTTDQKGAIAELAIAKAAIELGIDVYRPVAEGGRYDLIFELGNRLVRVQCKCASRYGDILVVRCYSARKLGTASFDARTSPAKSMPSRRTVPTSIAATSSPTTRFHVETRFSSALRARGTTRGYESIGRKISSSALHLRESQGP